MSRAEPHPRTEKSEVDCFDVSRAEGQTLETPIESVIDLLSATHAPEKIDEYREAMDRGATFPPIGVFKVGRVFVVTDGHKRLSACKQRGMVRVMVELWTVSRLLADLWDQTVRSTRRLVSSLVHTTHDPESRRRLHRLYWDTVLHWKRLFVTLPTLVRGGQPKDSASSAEAESARSTTLRLVRECAQFRGHLVLIFVSLAALGFAQLELTWIAKLWTDGPLKTGDQRQLAELVHRAIEIAVVLVTGLFTSRYLLQSLNQYLVQDLRDRAQAHLLEVELSTARRFQVGELMSRLFNDAGSLSQFVREILRRGIGETIVLVGALVILFRLDWRLATIMAVAGPLVGIVLAYCGGYIRRRSHRAQEEVGRLSASLTEQLSGLTTIKGFQTETIERERFAANDSDYRHHVMRSELWMASMTTGVWAITTVALLGVVVYGTNQIAIGRQTPGALLAFCLYAVQTVEPLRRLSEVHGLMQRALAAAVRVFEIIDLPSIESEGVLALPAPPAGALNFARVSFGYDRDRSVLDDIELKIAPRETVGVVAASGGGKSTLASLIVRFADPVSGRILLDGIDLRELRLAELRRAVCVMEQKPFVFSGSLFENIRYGSPQATREQVRTAASQAGLDQFIASLPGGLDSYLAESGRNLSGGQQQRIALARAIVRDPMVLILDEATSAIDSETEEEIFSRLRPWLAKRTVLLMTHRLSTVIRFPRVIVLDQGRIVGDGNAAQLLETCAVFKRLFAEQVSPLENPTRTLAATS
jgi:ATP-binding cassette, subfamily B, bacterial MsbA